jgi:hypothetical protein
MPEESHLHEMREAIRGDFERLAERRGEQELLRVDEPEDAADQPELEAPKDVEPAPEVEVEVEPDSDHETDPEQRSWLARFLSP